MILETTHNLGDKVHACVDGSYWQAEIRVIVRREEIGRSSTIYELLATQEFTDKDNKRRHSERNVIATEADLEKWEAEYQAQEERLSGAKKSNPEDDDVF